MSRPHPYGAGCPAVPSCGHPTLRKPPWDSDPTPFGWHSSKAKNGGVRREREREKEAGKAVRNTPTLQPQDSPLSACPRGRWRHSPTALARRSRLTLARRVERVWIEKRRRS